VWSVDPTRTGTATTYPARYRLLIQPASVLSRLQSLWNSGSSAAKLEMLNMGLNMNGMAFDRQRRLFHRLVQGGMGVDGAGDVLGAGAEFHRHRGFGDDGAGVAADDVNAQDAVALGLGQNFHETLGEGVGAGAGIGRERGLARVVFDARR